MRNLTPSAVAAGLFAALLAVVAVVLVIELLNAF